VIRVVRRHVAASLVLLLMPASASAQDLTPGAYWPIPRGINVVTALHSFNLGDVAFDPSAPIEDASATINTSVVAFTRAFRLGARSANASVSVPVVAGHLEGLYFGESAEADRFGLADPRLKLAVNLYGAPSMTPKEHASYRMRTIVGVSLSVVPPLGQYDETKLINIGANRWAFNPELGLARAYGRWVVEVMAGVWLFTDNDDFFGGRTREQDPIAETQLHVTYRFHGGMWIAADANYYTGGRTTIGGKENLDFQRNSRVGATFSKALKRGHAIRASISRGAYTTIGADFISIAAGYNYAWVNQRP
jgi:Putative MetA-pathway of phenol degradation